MLQPLGFHCKNRLLEIGLGGLFHAVLLGHSTYRGQFDRPHAARLVNNLFHKGSSFFSFPAELDFWNCGSGRDEEPSGAKGPPPDSDPFNDAEYRKNLVRL